MQPNSFEKYGKSRHLQLKIPIKFPSNVENFYKICMQKNIDKISEQLLSNFLILNFKSAKQYQLFEPFPPTARSMNKLSSNLWRKFVSVITVTFVILVFSVFFPVIFVFQSKIGWEIAKIFYFYIMRTIIRIRGHNRKSVK